jgi:proliferating cell nuclear antigen
MSANTESDTADAQPATTPDVEPDNDTEPEIEDEPEVEPDPESEDEVERESEAEEEAGVEKEEVEDAETVTKSPPQQFQAAIKGGEIKQFVGTLRAVVDEAKIQVGPDGIHTRAVDPANVAMYDVALAAGAFESYDATDGVLGLNLERFAEVLKLAKKDDLVQLSFNTTSFKLAIHIDGVEFTMALIDPDSIRPEPDLPEMDLPISLTLEEAQFARGVKAADMVSDHISFRCDESEATVYVEAEGDTDDINLKLTEDDLSELTAVDGQALYSLDYIEDISKQFPKGAEITLLFGSDFPMMFDYEFSEGECEVLAMVAPRIQTD